MNPLRSLAVGILCVSVALPVPAQNAPPPQGGGAAASAPASAGGTTFKQEELDQLVAPVALYPDALLAQVLMASTYPLAIVEAARWVKQNPNLKDKALEDALQQQSWDPAVKSLAAFPQVLNMMNEKLDWTQKLGDAFLAQQQDVMKTVQVLRQKANAQGNLKTTKEQTVTVEKDPTAATAVNQTVIKIEPANPEVVYVPTYNPTVVYGGWPYPAYPPYYYYPPGYVAGGALLGFTAGVIVGGALWGGCNWGGGDVNVNVNRYNNFNKTNISNGNWQHNGNNRGAVPYRDQGTANKYGRGASNTAQSREQFRGRAEAGQQSISRGDVPRDFDAGRASSQGALAGDRGGGAGDRGGAGAASRDAGGGGTNRGDYGGAGGRDMSGTRNSSAFDSGGRGGAQTRDYSSRGSSSMNSARSSGNYGGGGARGGGGGGGGRGGGGGGRGGGGRR